MIFSYELKIPKERIAVLIGKSGEIKSEIEKQTNSKITVDSKEGEVRITGEDSLGLFSAREIVKAIARGFNPEIAMLLLKGDYVFELISLSEITKDSKNHLKRIKGRIIGTDGKTRRIIESATETYICVYGKTVGIIGFAQNVAIARQAIRMIIAGSPHSTVYRWLEKKRKESSFKDFSMNEITQNLKESNEDQSKKVKR